MGMAASQARFLGLTARMNNVEFEGQQINQQRTALSNKSASYYTDLLGMEVPTAPSVEEFTQTVYTFNDGFFSIVACSILTLNAIFLLFEFYRKFKIYKFFPTCYFMLTLYLFCFLIDWF